MSEKLDEAVRRVIKEMVKDPLGMPEEFWTLLRGKLENDPPSYTREQVPSLDNVPCARLQRTTNQSLTNNAFTTITWESVDFDKWGMWDSGDPTKLMIKKAGLYLVGCRIEFDTSAVGNREVRLYRTGDIIDVDNGAGFGYNCHGVTQLIDAVVGDYFAVTAYQNSGGALNALAGSDFAPRLWAAWVGSPV